MSRLVVNPDSPEAWAIELGPGTLVLGSGQESGVVIQHSSVSSAHGSVTVSDNDVRLRDLGSTNGTFLNDELVEEVRLEPGQIVRLGEILLRFESDASADASVSATPPRAPRMPPPAASPTVRAGAARRQAPPQNFFAALPGAFVYPFQGNGMILLLAGTVFFYLIGHLPLVGLILTGYLFAYAKSIIASTADGRPEPPDWPDLSDLKEDIIMPYLQLAALVILSFGPAIAVRIWWPGSEAERHTAYFAALGLGAVFAPMGMLALAMFDSVAVLNPIALTWSILRVPLHYLVAAVAFLTVLALYWYADRSLRHFLPVPFLPEIIAGFLNLYFISLGMRILGLLYLSNAEKLGWFPRLGSR